MKISGFFVFMYSGTHLPISTLINIKHTSINFLNYSYLATCLLYNPWVHLIKLKQKQNGRKIKSHRSAHHPDRLDCSSGTQSKWKERRISFILHQTSAWNISSGSCVFNYTHSEFIPLDYTTGFLDYQSCWCNWWYWKGTSDCRQVFPGLVQISLGRFY